jgi:hypothetical protein
MSVFSPYVGIVTRATDATNFVYGRDFLNTWMGGRSMFSGGPAVWFDFATYNAAVRQMLGTTHYLQHFWSYPPHGSLIVGLGGYGKAATIIGLFYILGLVTVPFLPETNGKPLPESAPSALAT